MKKFNYCIARKWDTDTKELCVYAYYSEVQYGTLEDAEEFLKYVKKRNHEDTDWEIYVVKKLKRKPDERV